ncbi:MAG: hypothetical protein KF708_00405 [Pirellulales bacterium]|nr:hypothetical protein [Pirellulales bacterium]
MPETLHSVGKRHRRLTLLVGLIATLWGGQLVACPFCPALVPTLCQQRESAAVVLLAEIVSRDEAGARVRIHKILKGETAPTAGKEICLPTALIGDARGLVLLFGSPKTSSATSIEEMDWMVRPVDETSYAYFARAPGLRTPTSERLRYFVRFLEHPDPSIAADATMEFAHAPFSDVAAIADAFDFPQVRQWLADDRVPQERKGFYGLVLGLAAALRDMAANRELLHAKVGEPGADLRAGFDGMLAGLLLLDGEPALELMETRFLANPDSRDGDVRHALAALRFYAEYGRTISLTRIAQAVRPLLDRPEFASAAMVELARWQDWSALNRIVPLYDAAGYPQPGTRRAVVGYLLAAPGPQAAAALAELRRQHPAEVAEAEQHLSLFGGAK